MISITITGNTYTIRRMLKECLFVWNAERKDWTARHKESELNHIMELITPENDGIEIYVNLQKEHFKDKRFTLRKDCRKVKTDWLGVLTADSNMAFKKLPGIDEGFF